MSKPRRTMRRSSAGSSCSCGVAALLYPLLGACLWASVVGYKPVVIIHGLFDSSGDFKNLLRFINQVSDFDGGEWIFFSLCLCFVMCINNRYYRCFFYWPRCKQPGPYSLCNHVSPEQHSTKSAADIHYCIGTRIIGTACFDVLLIFAAMSIRGLLNFYQLESKVVHFKLLKSVSLLKLHNRQTETFTSFLFHCFHYLGTFILRCLQVPFTSLYKVVWNVPFPVLPYAYMYTNTVWIIVSLTICLNSCTRGKVLRWIQEQVPVFNLCFSRKHQSIVSPHQFSQPPSCSTSKQFINNSNTSWPDDGKTSTFTLSDTGCQFALLHFRAVVSVLHHVGL